MFNLEIDYEYFEDVNLGLVKYMPKDKKILDIGCGCGLLGEIYRKNQNYVVGIDLSPAINHAALERLDEFYNMDITDFTKVTEKLADNQFDVIIFADILEHIYDPISTVTFYKKFLKKDGKIYISVPNFVVWYSRLQILFGNYKYTDVGTNDKTHIRIFTRNNIKQLAKATALSIIKIDITPGIARYFVNFIRRFFKTQNKEQNTVKNLDRTIMMQSKSYKFYVKFLYNMEYYFCKIWPGMLAFQYIVVLQDDKKIS